MNECWAMDFAPDQLYNGRRLGALTVLDFFSRECEQFGIVDAGESVKYCRGEAGIHCVPKRILGELSIKGYTK